MAHYEINQFLRKIVLANETSYDLRSEALSLLIKTETQDFVSSKMGKVVQRFNITPYQYKQIQDLISGKQKIDAIKLLREFSGIGLKEAKDAVEAPENFDQLP